jgi:hypothetical protein
MRDFWAPAYSDILMTMLHDPVYRASSPTILAFSSSNHDRQLRAGLLDSPTGLAVLLLSDIGLFTTASSDKSPGDSLLFKQSVLRGVSYAPSIEPDRHQHRLVRSGASDVYRH